jgi:small subunit ribosomal protein S10e
MCLFFVFCITIEHNSSTRYSMLIPKQNRKAVYQYLFNEGVIVIKKDVNATKHAELDVPNLQVMKALQTLKSKNCVAEQFNWQYFYYFLNDEGILYLRNYLNIPESVVPATVAKASNPLGRPSHMRGEESSRRYEEQDGGHKREKKVGAAADFKPEFQGAGGVGRPTRTQQTNA